MGTDKWEPIHHSCAVCACIAARGDAVEGLRAVPKRTERYSPDQAFLAFWLVRGFWVHCFGSRGSGVQISPSRPFDLVRRLPWRISDIVEFGLRAHGRSVADTSDSPHLRRWQVRHTPSGPPRYTRSRTAGDAQYAEMTIHIVANTEYVGPAVRMASNTGPTTRRTSRIRRSRSGPSHEADARSTTGPSGTFCTARLYDATGRVIMEQGRASR